jgi:hypothetical protein
MKKGLLAAMVALFALSGCTKGVEKEYTMEIKEAPIVARLKDDETQTITVVHCKRGMSLFNYYIALPELAEDFVMPDKLTAKETDKKTKYIIINEKNKSETVSDHGYVFVKWGEK